MKAVTYRGPSTIKVVEKPEPRIEHPDDIVLRITRTAICGSDLHLYHGLVPDTRVGSTFGHEFAGVVEEVGSNVANVVRGDRVVVPFNISCGSCFFCSRALTSLCDNSNPANDILGGVFGYSHTTGGYDGGQAELVRVPFADVGPMKIPDDMTEEDVLFLSDIFPTGYQAAEMGDIKQGDTVCVFGAGPVGLFTMASAWLMGAGRVIAVDSVGYRLDFARKWQNVETVDYTEEGGIDVIKRLRDMTDGRGPDVCIDAVGCEASGSKFHRVLGMAKLQAGMANALEWAIDAVRKGGNVVAIGVYGPPWNLVPIGTAMNKGITIRAAQCNVKRYMPHLLEHIRAGRIDPKQVISHRLRLEDAPDAYEIFARKQDDCIKCVLVPPSARAA
ncbi:MAG TPA: zinc-dependent alcohol dehydrogenase [Labilithrix sp.]|jgi:threonine dehydrogenase-like Zn-dependent dehydrogenase